MQGALTSLNSLAGIIAPMLYASIFGLFISDRAPVHLPGMPFLVAGVFLATGVAVAWRFARPGKAPVAAPAPVAEG